jgi:hypothetical protein
MWSARTSPDLLPAELRGGRQLGGRRLPSVRLDVRPASFANACERALRPVREHGRPRQLRDELLHRLADPPGGVGPERRFDRRVEAPDRPQQSDDTLLQELGALNPGSSAVASRDSRDRGQERLDEHLARRLVAAGCGHYELPFPSRREGLRIVDLHRIPTPAKTLLLVRSHPPEGCGLADSALGFGESQFLRARPFCEDVRVQSVLAFPQDNARGTFSDDRHRDHCCG